MTKLLTMFAMTSLLASPAWGSVREAAFASSADRAPAAQTSMFAGATWRIGLDRRTSEPAGRASFKIARMVKTPTAQFRVGEGLALTAGANAKPALLVGGRPIDINGGKANLSDAGTIGIVVVGVLAVGAVAAYYALRDPCDHKECE